MLIPPSIPLDPGLPGAQGLIGTAGIAAVSGFVEDRGWTLGEEVRPVQALYRPGRSMVVRYRTTATDPQGGRHSLWLCAESRRRPRDPKTVPSEAPLHRLPDPIERRGDYLVWAFPSDPGLPDNALVTEGNAVVSHLTDVVHHRTEPVRYRPRRRTVFKTRAMRRTDRGNDWTEVYVKVMEERKVDSAMRTAELLAPHANGFALVFPRHRPGSGTLVFDAHPGTNMRQLLVDPAASLPHPRRVAELVDGLANIPVDAESLPEAGDPVYSVERAQELLTLLVPALDEPMQAVRRAVERGAAAAESGRRGVVHGDMYEGQLLVNDDFTLTVIDTDGMAWGNPLDDAANFLAHLVALADSYPDQRERLLAYRDVARRALETTLDVEESDLLWREALSMVWLATGPFRVLSTNWPIEVERRVRVAARMLEDAV